MKKSIFLFSLFLSTILWSCGSENTKEKTTGNLDPEKTLEVSREEAMMNILGELNINIPEELTFDRGGENYIYFSADSVNADLKQKLDDYYNQLRVDLKANGWSEKELEKDMDLGGITTRYAFEKIRPDDDGQRKMIVSKKYFEDFLKYSIGFQYKP